MKVLVAGGTGLLGRSVIQESKRRATGYAPRRAIPKDNCQFAPVMEQLAILKAHKGLGALHVSGLRHTIARPTGCFLNIGECLQVAKWGRARLVGDSK